MRADHRGSMIASGHAAPLITETSGGRAASDAVVAEGGEGDEDDRAQTDLPDQP
jgi:hypothetical protein